ncbi:EamA family transporter [Bdellovibrio sp. HCB337]|uniref:EamA family transporter n=1 Tax=Bdellovibrio sp. HCB337 TaxID=3394358 RepID=UPI0039A53D35
MNISSILILIAAMLSIQSGAALAKQLFPLVGPNGVTLLRTSLAALILLAIWRPWKAVWTKQQLQRVALYGASLGFMNLLFYLSLQYIPLGIAVGLEFTGPLAVALLASRRVLDFLWALLAGVGIVLILPLTEASAGIDLKGALLALAAGGFWALYIVFGKKAGEGTHGGQSATMGMVFAALVSFPFGAIDAGTKVLDMTILPLGLAVAVLSSAIPYSLEMISLKRIPIKTFGILMSLEPVLAALAGAVFLKEYLSVFQMAAIACIVIASLGSTLTAKEVVVTTDI